VALHVAETLHAAFPGRYGVSPGLAALVAAKRPGIWEWGPEGQRVDPVVAQAFAELGGTSPWTAEQVRDAALAALAEEIHLMLAEGVVAEAQDIDLCMLLGAGWPFWNGGITPYLDRTGISVKVTGQTFLTPGVASVAR
jgi:hypothetical protein